MKRTLMVALVLAVALAAGCKKQEQNPPPAINAEQPKSLDTIQPVEPPVTEPPVVAGTSKPTPPPAPPLPSGTNAGAKSGSAGTAGTSGSAHGKTYTVAQGDTIYGISRKVYGTDKRAKDIISANPGIDPNKLKVGQVIKLPD